MTVRAVTGVRRYPELRLLLAARFVSVTGHIVMLVAMAWLAVEATGSSLYGGVLIGAFLLPGLIVPVVGGPLIDRFARRDVVRVVELVR